MNAALIVNPESGREGDDARRLECVRASLDALGLPVDDYVITPGSSAGVLARTALERGCHPIIVGGGDGTVGPVARELIPRKATLGIIPLGTFNNIARSLAIPDSIEDACRVIRDGRSRDIDVGLANSTRYFFEAAGVGLDAALFPIGQEIKEGSWKRMWQAIRMTHAYRQHLITFTFDRPLGEALPRNRHHRLGKTELQGHSIRLHCLMAVAANGPYYGSALHVAPDALLTDGLLTIHAYRRFSKWELVRHFWGITKGRRRYSPKVETFLAKEVRIETGNPLPAHLDGQSCGHTPLDLNAVPAALRVITPKT